MKKKLTSAERRRRKRRQDKIEYFGKFFIIALLLALYIYDINTRFGGIIHFGSEHLPRNRPPSFTTLMSDRQMQHASCFPTEKPF